MADKKISQLNITTTADDNSWLVMNDSGNTATFRIKRSDLLSGTDANGLVNGTGTDSIKSDLTSIPATASGTNSIAIGKGAQATNTNSISIGTGNNTRSYSIAIGDGLNGLGDQNIQIGKSLYGSSTNGEIQIGQDLSTGSGSISIGNNTYNGQANRAGGQKSVTIGQSNRLNQGNNSVIIGQGNESSNTSSLGTVVMGRAHILSTSGTYNTILGGTGVNISGASAGNVVIGQNTKTLNGSTVNSTFIGGDNFLTSSGSFHTLVGGETNSIIDTTDHGTIVGGSSNTLSSNTAYSSILGSIGSSISDNGGSVAVGGSSNTLTSGSVNVSVGGYTNDITGGDYGFLAGGVNNELGGSGQKNVVIGGEDNLLQNSGNRNGIFGGYQNTMNVATNQNYIFGGISNQMTNNPYQSAILAGQSNQISGGNEKSVIIGGYLNNITSYGDISTIIGSQNCSSLGYKTIIYGGENNHIYNDSRFSGIWGGFGNQINSSNTQGAVILNSWQSRMEGSGGERHIIINSDSSSITGNSYTTKHATIIASTNSGIGADKERAVLIGLSGQSALYSATTQVENIHTHKTETFDIIDGGNVGGNIDVDSSLGTIFTFTMTADTTPNFINLRSGQRFIFIVENVGSYAVPTATVDGVSSTVYAKNGSLNPTNGGYTKYTATYVNGILWLDEELNFQAV